MSRLTDTDVLDIVADRKRGMKVRDIADFYEVSVATVAGILNGRTHGKLTGIQKAKNPRPGRKPALPKLEVGYRQNTHSRRICFEFTAPDGTQRMLRDRVSDTTSDDNLRDMAQFLCESKETYKIYVRYENGTLLRTIEQEVAGVAQG